MKVKNCTGCIFAKRQVRVIRYHPANYHTIGMTSYYMWCDLCHKRCSDVKKSECDRIEKEQNNDR